jgi:hypothetical protein
VSVVPTGFLAGTELLEQQVKLVEHVFLTLLHNTSHWPPSSSFLLFATFTISVWISSRRLVVEDGLSQGQAVVEDLDC